MATVGKTERVDLIIKDNATFKLGFYIKDPVTKQPIPLAGWAVLSQFREEVDGDIVDEFSDNDGFTIDENAGYVELTISPTRISAWEARSGVWDIQFSVGSEKNVYIGGAFEVEAGVTK